MGALSFEEIASDMGVSAGPREGSFGTMRSRILPLWDLARRAVGSLRRPRLDHALLGALNSVPHGFCIYDADDRLVFANEGFSLIYKQPRETLPAGLRFLDMLRASIAIGNYSGRTAEEIWTERKAFIDRCERGTFLQTMGDGRLIAISHQPLEGGGWVAVYEDITERSRTEMHLRFMAHHDALTMLPNRLMFGERLDEAIEGAAANSICALLCLDLDGFKPVNDRLGHAAGDELLRQVADRLRGVVRDTGVAARLGGDEFAVLLPQAGEEIATQVAARIGRSIRRSYDLGASTEINVGVSIGIACAPAHATTSVALMAHADAALYMAKRRRGGRPYVYDGSPDLRSAVAGLAGAA